MRPGDSLSHRKLPHRDGPLFARMLKRYSPWACGSGKSSSAEAGYMTAAYGRLWRSSGRTISKAPSPLTSRDCRNIHRRMLVVVFTPSNTRFQERAREQEAECSEQPKKQSDTQRRRLGVR